MIQAFKSWTKQRIPKGWSSRLSGHPRKNPKTPSNCISVATRYPTTPLIVVCLASCHCNGGYFLISFSFEQRMSQKNTKLILRLVGSGTLFKSRSRPN